MALITRCPVCGTRFKVVPDQLRISDGWVRCGECGEVFDASADLSQGELPSPVVPPADNAGLGAGEGPPSVRPQSDWHAPWSSRPPTVVSESANAAPTLAPTGTARAARIDWDAEASFSETWLRKRDASYGDDAEGADSLSLPASLENRRGRRLLEETEPVPAQAVADPPAEAAPVADDNAPPAEVQVAEAYQREDKYEDDEEEDAEEVSQALAAFPADMSTLPEDTVYVVPPPPAQVDAALDEPQLSFLKADVRPAISAWQRPWVRPALIALAGLLTLTLIGQAAIQQRDVLAAQMPAAKPLLQALCAPFGCKVQPLRRIESIVIDNSTFTTLRRGVYRLNVVLKNRGSTELAVPSIELALTDTQEQPVLRRVLQPVDMAAVSGNISPIAADGEWTASMELSVAEEALIGRIVGYRLLAFYP